MIPIVTPEEMRAIDADSPEPVEVLVLRAARAVARAALQELGGAYGRRVTIIAGPGFNGEDARLSALQLERSGVRCRIIDPEVIAVPAAHLIIDGAYGTGLSRDWFGPDIDITPVLAVDIPSGIHGLTGEVRGRPLTAARTVTFAALKPGLLLQPGASFAGRVTVADIGLDVSRSTCHLVTDADVGAGWTQRRPGAHKWNHSVRVVAGSPGMEGAAYLVTASAMRAGAGYVRCSSPGETNAAMHLPVEVVGERLPDLGWAGALAADAERFRALVIGPGLGRSDDVDAQVRDVVGASRQPVVIDADAIAAYAGAQGLDRPDVIMTPHDGEFATLTGAAPAPNRIGSVVAAAVRLGCIVLLKGPATVIANPAGQSLIVTSGDQRLATAGTGDVLAGIIAALLARGIEPFEAAAFGAHIHGLAGRQSPIHGTVATDVVAGIGPAISSCVEAGPQQSPQV